MATLSMTSPLQLDFLAKTKVCRTNRLVSIMNLSMRNRSSPIHSRPIVAKKPEMKAVAVEGEASKQCSMTDIFSASSSWCHAHTSIIENFM